ncbi:hypothetical protein Cni_G05735 [Canna indica]|uniref:TSL-kinase interacting protein 1 n=1 Tax=Canna indica TaxID=4628 RepID=A0AAQ3Q5P0_9LILI|nr:hypothetical protein Cni_G05735 [Canna indica]
MKASCHQHRSPNSGTKNGLGCNKSGIKTTKQKRKITGKKSPGLGGELLTSIQSHHLKTQDAQACFLETAPGEFKSVQGQGQLQDSCGKIKLQLFPIDEDTRKRLQKDNHNPYLELTLTTRKKISSVVKHLNMKWDSSKLASGELMLFPYSICLDNLVNSRRWTLVDSDITTADVHASLGSPAIFQLRYGWFSNLEQTTCQASPTPASCNILKSDNDCDKNITYDDKLLCSISSKEHELFPMDDSAKDGVGTPFISEETIKNEGEQNDGRSDNMPWVDCLSNMSFGAILSEVSDTPTVNPCHQLPAQNSNLQQIPINCDSFDAAIAAFMARSQSTNPYTRMSHSSILEAEDTCHAFPYAKATSSNKDPASCRYPPVTVRCDNMRGSQVEQASSDNVCPVPATNLEHRGKFDACLEPESGLQSHPQDRLSEDLNAQSELQTEDPCNGSNQFGGTNLILSDSLGPVEFVAPCSKETNDGETIGLDGLIASSMDAFQNFSIF